MGPVILAIQSAFELVSKQSTSRSIQQVAPQAAKTMSPPFARMGGFGGGSSNSFDQMPTGASPTTTSGANYPPMNVRASLNTNGYGTFCMHNWHLFLCVLLACSLTPVYFDPRWFSVWSTVPPSRSRGSMAAVAGPAAAAAATE